MTKLTSIMFAGLFVFILSVPASAHMHRTHTIHLPGATVKLLPKAHKVVVVKGTKFFTKGGIYYSRSNGRYVVAAAPVGLTVTALPRGHVSFHVKKRRYYFFAGNYYVARSGAYVVVKRPAHAPKLALLLK